MKGALLELVARGVDDINLIGNPQFSYFKSVYRTHTNFSKFESVNVFQGGYGFGRKATCVIDRKGDLLTGCLLCLKLPPTGNSLVSWINGIGNFIIKKLTLKIGGETINEMSGEYLDIFFKHYLQTGHYTNYSDMVKKILGYREISLTDEQILFIPLPFWFSKGLEHSLPLISIGFHEVSIDIEFRDLVDCLYSASDKSGLSSLVNLNNLEIQDAYISNSFIYLDKEERAHFAQKDSIYLIEQIQEDVFTIEDGSSTKNIPIHFNHPIKEIIWQYRSNYFENLNRWDKYSAFDISSGTEKKPILFSELLFNGQERFTKLTADYFRLVQPVLHHNSSGNNFIYYYCFANNVDSIQPSGTSNFSKIDDVKLNLTFPTYITAGNIRLYALNYNFLRVKGGMAGLLYS